MPRTLLDRFVRLLLRRPARALPALPLGAPYRTPARPEAGALREVVALPVRLLGVVLMGEVELGLDGLRFVPLRGRPRNAALGEGLSGLHLGFLAVVEDPTAASRLPDSWQKGSAVPFERHGTVRVLQFLRASPGFRGGLDERPHPERFLLDAAEWGSAGDEMTYSDGFVAIGEERLVFLSSDQLSWASAAGRDIPDLGFMDSRHEILSSALAWLTDEAFGAALARARMRASTYDRDEVRRGERKADGRLSIGALDLRLSAAEEARLTAWVDTGST